MLDIFRLSPKYSAQSSKTHVVGGDLPPVGVHAGHEVDPGVVDEPLDGLVAGEVALAEVVGEVEEHLAAKDLVAVHVGDVLHLGLHCTERTQELETDLRRICEIRICETCLFNGTEIEPSCSMKLSTWG